MASPSTSSTAEPRAPSSVALTPEPLPTWIPFGRIARAHGVRGELRLVPYDGIPELPERCSRLRLVRVGKDPKTPRGVGGVLNTGSGGAAGREVEVRGARPANDAILLTLNGITDRDAAEGLRGLEAQVRYVDLPAPGPGEHYSFELVGTVVEVASEAPGASDSTPKGIVREVMEQGSQELLSIHDAAGVERLFPLTAAQFVSFDRQTRHLVVRDPAGLLSASVEEAGKGGPEADADDRDA